MSGYRCSWTKLFYGVLLLNANTQIPLVHLQAQERTEENFLMCKFPVSCLPFLSWCSYTNVLMCSLHQPLCWYHLRFLPRPPPPPPPSFNINEYVGKRVYADISENTRIINAGGEMKSNLCVGFTMALIHLYLLLTAVAIADIIKSWPWSFLFTTIS